MYVTKKRDRIYIFFKRKTKNEKTGKQQTSEATQEQNTRKNETHNKQRRNKKKSQAKPRKTEKNKKSRSHDVIDPKQKRAASKRYNNKKRHLNFFSRVPDRAKGVLKSSRKATEEQKKVYTNTGDHSK